MHNLLKNNTLTVEQCIKMGDCIENIRDQLTILCNIVPNNFAVSVLDKFLRFDNDIDVFACTLDDRVYPIYKDKVPVSMEGKVIRRKFKSKISK